MSRRILLLLVAIALLISVWWLTKRAPSDRKPAPAVPTEVASEPAAPPSSPLTPPGNSASDNAQVQPAAEDPASLRPRALVLGSGPLAWEQQLAEATSRARTAPAKAAALLSLLPTLPAEALATAAEQAIERLPDRDYAAVALPVVSNADTAGAALSVLFADLMERPDSIALPALLTIARNPRHPFAEPALDNLRLLLRSDFGRDWAKWTAAIERQTHP